MVIFQHKNVAQGYFKINNCSKQEQAFLAWSKSFWNTVLWNEVALHATLFTYEQKWHLDLPAKIIASVGESTSLNTRPRATLCHFSFFFQCVFKYFLQGVVNYWSIFRIKINLMTKRIHIQDTATRILASLFWEKRRGAGDKTKTHTQNHI